MKKAVLYSIVFFTALSYQVNAQKFSFPEDYPALGDTISSMLKSSNNENAKTVGENIPLIWQGFGPDITQKIGVHVKKMEEKNFRVRPHLQLYFQVLVNAVNVEGADQSKLLDYLYVTEKVIENYESDQVIDYFKTMATFFEHHALFYSRGHKVFVMEDNYTLEFIQPEVIEEEYVEEEYVEEESDEWSEDEWSE
ncbi:MAG: hypothetical protein OEY34_08570, partial [Cyclobacteriaceae bacterium]|nr:hypothetical protein [Cyclobacteriaceae bacterium]